MLDIFQDVLHVVGPWTLHLIVGFVTLLYFKKYYNSHIQPWAFSKFYPYLIHCYNDTYREIKGQHLKSMKNHKSADVELRKKGVLRVLEIGPGPGYNFEFYPANCELTVVEVNPFFEDQFFKKQADHPHIKMNRFVVGFAENMKDIPDNSVDIVVSTLVLCSVRSVEAALKEIHRILAPGGKYYFWEHVLDQENIWARILQHLISYTYQDLICGCQLNRKSGEIVQSNKAGFSHIEHERFRVPVKKGYEIPSFVMIAHSKGIATK